MPIYIQDLQYSGETPKRLGWSWNGSQADPNTDWAQFQYRSFAHVGLYYYLSGDADAKQILENFRTWLKSHSNWGALPNQLQLPVDLTPNTELVANSSYSPGVFGLAAQGLIYLAARDQDATVLADAKAILDALQSHQVTGTGPAVWPVGGFPATDSPTSPRYYGYENGEAGIAFSLYDLLPNTDQADLLNHALTKGLTFLPVITRH